MNQSSRSNGSLVWGACAMAVITIAGYMLYTSGSKQRDARKQQRSQKAGLQSETDHMLMALFQQAVTSSSNLKALPNGDKLMLYGLYKQASTGDAPTSGPSMINMVAHAKHSAWSNFRGMPQTTAMFHYIQAVRELGAGESISDDDSSSLGMNAPMGGMGLKPSMMMDESIAEENGSLEAQLRTAAATDDVMAIKELVEEGADINSSDEAGETALHFCADRGMLDGVIYLLELGADANAKDNDGISVLQAAVIAGHVDVCRVLLEKGAEPDSEDADGDTPRSCAEEDNSAALQELFESYS